MNGKAELQERLVSTQLVHQKSGMLKISNSPADTVVGTPTPFTNNPPVQQHPVNIPVIV